MSESSNKTIVIDHYDGYSKVFCSQLPVSELLGVQQVVEAHQGGEIYLDFKLSSESDALFVAGTEEALERLRDE